MRGSEYDSIEKHQAAMAALGRRVSAEQVPPTRIQRAWQYTQEWLGLTAMSPEFDIPPVEAGDSQTCIELFGEDQVADVIDLDSWREQSTSARREQQS